jgi:hypothetical protein
LPRDYQGTISPKGPAFLLIKVISYALKGFKIMKYLLLTLVLLQTGLLTACGGQIAPQNQDILSDISNSQSPEADPGVLESFVSAINNHSITEALDFFNDSANVTEFSLVNLRRNSELMNLAYTRSGKAEIKGWLEYKISSISEITPVEYKVSDNTVILKAVFNYTDQADTFQITAQTEEGKINNLCFFDEGIR